MSMKRLHFFHAFFSSPLVLLMALLINGCATIDKMFFNNPSPTNSPPSPSPISVSPSPPQPSNSPTSPNSNIEEQLDRLVTTKKCLPPNPAEYISGDFKLSWTVGASPYQGLLTMKGRVGKMRIQYFNADMNQSDTVDQIMVLASCTEGLVIFGYNPVSASTNQTHPTYSADNLILRLDENGNLRIINQDDQGVRVPVDMEPISN